MRIALQTMVPLVLVALGCGAEPGESSSQLQGSKVRVANETSAPADASSSCSSRTYGGHSYLFCTDKKTWQAAQDSCAASGYNLASVNDASENTWIVDTSLSIEPSPDFTVGSWWLGTNDIQSEGVWKFVSGEPTSYTPFAASEPNGSSSENCIHMRRYSNAPYSWNDASCSGWAFNYICESQAQACGDLVPVKLSDYNLFVLGDYSGGHDVQGKVAAGGTITMTDFSVGEGLPANDIARTLVAGGTLALSRGGVWGDAWYGGNYSYNPSVTIVRGSVLQGTPIDFTARGAELRTLSSQLAGRAPNGTMVRESWGGVMLRGTDPSLNVFNVAASAFTGATLLSIDAPAGSLAVLNIRGSSATFTSFGSSFSGGIDQHGVLYNFVDTTSINASGYGFWGTVLAPYARITFNNGSFDGGIYALSMTGNAEGHINPLTDHDLCGAPRAGTWTPWRDRDNPSANGDYELASLFPPNEVCNGATPLDSECTTLDGIDWRQAGQVYSCTPSGGGVCVNADQPGGQLCLDYRVRFLCP